ncbi:MAG: aldose 1-epimerase family protein [bacterium]
MKIFGESYAAKQIRRLIGRTQQIGGIRQGRFEGGPEDNARFLQFETGTGFSFTVLPDRGMDIASAKYCGASLSWDSPCGEAHPSFYEPEGLGWLRTFYGGLVCTCGLTWMGAPCVDKGEPLGLHGRYSHLPCRNFQVGEEWEGDNCVIWAQGEMRETVVFGVNVLLRRRISTVLGSNTIVLEDRVTNEGFQSTPHMMLYHINLGFPVVSPGSRLLSPAKEVQPRDEEAADGLARYNRFDPPKPGYKEKVYFHEMPSDRKGMVTVALVNRGFNNRRGLGVVVRYRKKELPRFIQWKNMGATTYVCGLEPANSLVMGRAYERKHGTLQSLRAGETREYRVEIGVLPDKAAIAEAESAIGT